jgi:hypothetical protein
MRKYPEIDEPIFMKHLEQAYCENLVQKYSAKGYEVYTGYQFPNGPKVDFMAQKNDEKIVIEIKNGKLSPEKRDTISRVKRFVDEHKNIAQFKIAFLNPPQIQKVEFDGLERIICNDMRDKLPAELAQLAAGIYPKEITDLDIETLRINEGDIHITGAGVIDVKIDAASYDSFPFEFSITLTKDFEIKVSNYNVDTSS